MSTVVSRNVWLLLDAMGGGYAYRRVLLANRVFLSLHETPLSAAKLTAGTS